MPDEPTNDGAADGVDPGPPIAELASLKTEGPRGFLDRVRVRIERRQAGSHVLALSWHGAAAVFFEFLSFFFGLFEPDGKGGSRDR